MILGSSCYFQKNYKFSNSVIWELFEVDLNSYLYLQEPPMLQLFLKEELFQNEHNHYAMVVGRSLKNL